MPSLRLFYHPKLPIRSPLCREHHVHCQCGRRSDAFGRHSCPCSKVLQTGRTTGLGGIMVGLKSGSRLIMLTLPLALGGCAGALLVGGLAGVASGGYAAAHERGVGGAASDLQIETTV